MSTLSMRKAFCKGVVDKFHDGARKWNEFWFTPTDPAALAVVRILTGLVLLYIHFTTLPLCLDAIGPDGWVDAQAWNELVGMERPYRWSLWSLIQSTPAIVLTYGLFIVAIVCLTIGFGSRWAAVLVWVGQLSYAQRGFSLGYGLESVAAFLTLYLLIGPCGGAFSVDAWLAARRGKLGRKKVAVKDHPSVGANIAIRCIQIHMCVVYLAAGLAKLQGSLWWSGLATYYAAMSPEMWPMEFNVEWVGRHPMVTQTVANLSVLFTLAFEIGFAFLIWNRRLRPLILVSAVLLHLGIGVMMGLGSFGVIMLAGCSAFVLPETWRSISGYLSNRCSFMTTIRVSVHSAV